VRSGHLVSRCTESLRPLLFSLSRFARTIFHAGRWFTGTGGGCNPCQNCSRTIPVIRGGKRKEAFYIASHALISENRFPPLTPWLSHPTTRAPSAEESTTIISAEFVSNPNSSQRDVAPIFFGMLFEKFVQSYALRFCDCLEIIGAHLCLAFPDGLGLR
jgi:hypothetical protein